MVFQICHYKTKGKNTKLLLFVSVVWQYFVNNGIE